MAGFNENGRNDPGYVEYGTICDERYPITPEYIYVMNHMPPDEEEIIAHQHRSTGFGPEPGVIIDETDDRLACYGD